MWRKFNNFLICLDKKPPSWEERASLFGASLVDQGIQSSTLRSYMSAIKGILIDDGFQWDNTKLLLSTLIRGCKVVNDCVRTRLPIQKGLLEMILFEIQRIYRDQFYLEILYKTVLSLCYYGLFRIGELTSSQHTLKAQDGKHRRQQRQVTIYPKILKNPWQRESSSRGQNYCEPFFPQPEAANGKTFLPIQAGQNILTHKGRLW